MKSTFNRFQGCINNKVLALFSSFFVVAVVCILPISYDTNDNVGILISIENNVEVPFISFILKQLLSWCYVYWSEDLPWYSIFLYFVHMMSISLFLMGVFCIKSIRRYLYVITIIYLIVYSNFLIRVGINNASIMIGANSLFYFLVLMQKGNDIAAKNCIVLGFIFSFSYLIRVEAVLAVVVFSIPILLIAIRYAFNTAKFKYYIIFFLVPFFVIVGDKVLEEGFKSEVYKDYTDFNKARGQIHGMDILEANRGNEELLRISGWSDIDYKAFESWLFFDERKYNIGTMVAFENYPSSKEFKLEVVREKVEKWLVDYRNLIAFFFLPMLIVLIFRLGVEKAYPVIGYQLYAIIVMLYMVMEYRFPIRIGYPIFLLCLTMQLCLFALSPKLQDAGKNILERITVRFNTKPLLMILTLNMKIVYQIAGVVIAVWSLFVLADKSIEIKEKSKEFDDVVKVINSLQRNAIILHGAIVIGYEYMNPLVTYKSVFSHDMITPGWPMFSPMFYREIDSLGIKKGGDLLSAMLDNENAYLMLSQGDKSVIQDVAGQELGFESCLSHISQLPKYQNIYKLQTLSSCHGVSFFPALDSSLRTTGKFIENYLKTGSALVSGKGDVGYLHFGPYVDINKGSYKVAFDIFSEGANNDPVVILEVTGESGKDLLARKSILSSDGPQELYIDLKTGSDLVEFRVWVTGEATVVFRGINIAKVKDSQSLTMISETKTE